MHCDLGSVFVFELGDFTTVDCKPFSRYVLCISQVSVKHIKKPADIDTK